MPPDATPLRRHLRLRGAVQGVGFRPFIYRLARELGLTGYVTNDPGGVTVEVEGAGPALDAFAVRLLREAPAAARPELVTTTPLAPTGDLEFVIRASAHGGPKTAVLLPDIALCADCRRELADPSDRRYRYPFINCTNCGPRFSIIRTLPYDRPHTTMSGFPLCERCAGEYADPQDRRFHAQPNACPDCGPTLTLTDASGAALARHHAALEGAARAVQEGRILALKGLGGFHLVVDAADPAAVERLRARKTRWEKPFAVLVPSLASAATLVELGPAAAALLAAPAAPIVLLPRRATAPLAAGVAPGNPLCGVLLPYTPLHVLLQAVLDRPLVATSGNTSDEPIAIDDAEARERLGHIADVFLGHDRPIERQVDDSVVTLVAGAPLFIRRSRGYAPQPVRLPASGPTVLALGPHLKNTVALAIGDEVFMSQHVGDLSNPVAAAAHTRIVRDFMEMYDAAPAAVACDLHPDAHGTTWLEQLAACPADAPPWQQRIARARRIPVQHHHAHLAACLAEHGNPGTALGITWDGTGYGTDGTIWGGECLVGDATRYERVAHLRPFRLLGGDAAVLEPRRTAFALLAEAGLLDQAASNPAVQAFTGAERRVLEGMLARGVNSPITTSAGRLFDGVAALAGLRQRAAFEAQAALELEWAAGFRDAGEAPLPPYPFPLVPGRPLVLDWAPLVASVVTDVQAGVPSVVVSRRFHEALVTAIVTLAKHVGEHRVVLTGGCFQNRYLVEGAVERLAQAGFEVLVHRQVPPNDGGVSLGQVAVAAAALAAPTAWSPSRP